MERLIRGDWFQQISKDLIYKHSGEEEVDQFSFSNRLFHSFLSWHQISLQAVTNKVSKLPSNFGDTILNWMRFYSRNSQPHKEEEMELTSSNSDTRVSRYRLRNVCNINLIRVPYEFIERHTYNIKNEKTIWMEVGQSSS